MNLPGGLPAMQPNSQGNIPSNIPVFRFTHGKGCTCWDANGNRYTDYICGYGPVILGHANEVVNRAVREQLERGLLFPADNDLIDDLHARLQHLFPGMSMMRCVKTGSEAVASAVRLARAHTGRSIIIRCGFHGWHDQMVAPYRDWHTDTFSGEPEPVLGLPPDAGHILAWDGQDLNVLSHLLEANKNGVAGLIVDPVQLREPLQQNLRGLRMLADQYGVPLILDELKTGLRIGPSGVQGRYGVWADIVVLGKAIANGLPLAIVLAPEWAVPLVRKAKLKGTYNSELGSIAAAIATLQEFQRLDGASYLEDRGAELIRGLNEAAKVLDLEGLVEAGPFRWSSMPYIRFNGEPKEAASWKGLFYRTMATRGHLMLRDHMSFIMMAHTASDIQATVQTAGQVLSDLRRNIRGL